MRKAWKLRARAFACASLATAMVASPRPSTAGETDGAVVMQALLEAAISSAERKETFGLDMLNLALGMNEPWAPAALHMIENSQLPKLLAEIQRSGITNTGSQWRTLTARLSVMQGSQRRRDSLKLPGQDEIRLELEADETVWLDVAKHRDSGELLIESAECTPEIEAFPMETDFPATPLKVLARYSDSLASLPGDIPLALRVRLGDCPPGALHLKLRRIPARRSLAHTSVAKLDPDRVSLVHLQLRSAQVFEFETEPGYVYEVFAAPLQPGLDPQLMRAGDPGQELVPDSDDDGGWQTGARLRAIVGRGSPQKMAVVRLVGSTGTVALLLDRQPVPRYSAELRPALQLQADIPVWRRLSLPAGGWSIKTVDLDGEVDPALLVMNEHGAEIARNDDLDDDTVAAQVDVMLDKPAELLLRLDTVRPVPGQLRLEIRRTDEGRL